MKFENIIFRLQPWKDPERNFVEYGESLGNEDGALKAGILRGTICIPDKDGKYQAYDERGILVGSTAVGYMSDVTDCPRFRKCDECPNKQTETTLRLAQDNP